MRKLVEHLKKDPPLTSGTNHPDVEASATVTPAKAPAAKAPAPTTPTTATTATTKHGNQEMTSQGKTWNRVE